MNYDSPQDIKDGLDALVVGQDKAKWALANAVFLYEMQLRKSFLNQDCSMSSHVLLAGESGSGKSHLAISLAKSLDMPLLHVNCTTLTQPGFTGIDIADALKKQIVAHNLSDRPMAIVLLDEIDKLTEENNTNHGSHGAHIQNSLMPLLDGLPLQTSRDSRSIKTDHLLIIATGVFKTVKYSSDYTTDIRKAVISAGLKEELTSRFVDIEYLDPLTDEQLFQIVFGAQYSPLKFYEEVFQNCDHPFELSDIERMKIKHELKGNARNIQSILFNILSVRLRAIKPGIKLFMEDINNDLGKPTHD